jgi:hypothetical protein
MTNNRFTFQEKYAKGGDRVLNVGCNDCKYPLNIPVTNLDMDRWNVPNFIQADAVHLPFKDNAFDVIILGDCIEHIYKWRDAIAEAVRVTSKYVVITVPRDDRTVHIPRPYSSDTEAQMKGYNSEEDLMVNEHPNLCKGIVPNDTLRHGDHVVVIEMGELEDCISKLSVEIVEFLVVDYHFVDEGYFICVRKQVN